MVDALNGGEAYETFQQIVGEIPAAQRFSVPAGAERSAWQIVEHMRITLEDLAGYVDNENGTYVARKWPEEYWPKATAPEQESGWNEAVAGFLAARWRLQGLILDPNRDLLRPFSWSEDGHTLLREAILAIDHTAYHLGELVELTFCLKGAARV